MDAPLDWTLVQSFLAVAETGSLSAAARRLGQSQPTLGRHIRALEEQLKAELFRRVPRGLEPTEAGAALVDPARAMAEAAARLHRTADGRDESLAGTVRITASVVVAHYLLPPLIAQLRAEEPGIEIEITATDTTQNLLFREADIGLRMYRPDQPATIARKLSEQALGLYAHRDWLARHGTPTTPEEAMAMGPIGFDRSDLMLVEMARMGLAVDRHVFPIRTDDQVLVWQLALQGCGMSFMQQAIAQQYPQMQRLLPDLPLPKLPLWIVAPEALRTTPRIRRVWDLLVAGLARPR